jgi:hypothetical protein
MKGGDTVSPRSIVAEPKEANTMAKYVGLTDDPAQRKQEHGYPADWSVVTFQSEAQARAWEQQRLAAGYEGGPGGGGWRFGYTFTITRSTRQ